MARRFISIWFPQLVIDWHIRRNSFLKKMPFALVVAEHGRMVITACNKPAANEGITTGMNLADAKALNSLLLYKKEEPGRAVFLLKNIAEWCIRFTPLVAIDEPEGLILDISGCAHLWGGEKQYLADLTNRLNSFNYHVNIAIADTIGAAWAMARYGTTPFIIKPFQQPAALMKLPPAALRLDTSTTDILLKLGLVQIGQFMSLPQAALRLRFGAHLLKRLAQALGTEQEFIQPVYPALPHQERLHSLEPIVTATGISIALKRLLETLCKRLQQQQQGLRTAIFKCFRVDGKTEQVHIATNSPSHDTKHLFKLFEDHISSIEPALGIELFILEAPVAEDYRPAQEQLWSITNGLQATGLVQLLDRISGKFGLANIHRYIPAEHYWPERSFKHTDTLLAPCHTTWKAAKPRPVTVLATPHIIKVTAPVPDYPPMNFQYKGRLHKVIHADGPERIEQEWWLQDGQHRDYYCIEDEEGSRYWIFRLGHYDEVIYQWFLHGFFA